jgi:hypothetical protein
VSPGGIGRLLIERLAVANTASEELRPVGNFGERVDLFRQEAPESGVMPAEIVLRAVAMLADAVPQLPNFRDELLARHLFEVIVHSDRPFVLKIHFECKAASTIRAATSFGLET